MKSLNKIVLTSIIVMFTAVSNANLITNGSFEDNTLAANSWGLYSETTVNGWNGASIELWNNLFNTPAYEGNNLTELNSNNNGGQAHTLFQSFSTSANDVFTLDFAYRARKNANEAFRVDIFSTNGNVFSQIFDDHVTTAWSTFSGQFTANSNNSTIMFTSIAPLSSVGNLLDNIVIEQANNVSSPATLLITLLALPLVFARRFSK